MAILAVAIASWLTWRWQALQRDVDSIVAAAQPHSAVSPLFAASERLSRDAGPLLAVPLVALAGRYAAPITRPIARVQQHITAVDRRDTIPVAARAAAATDAATVSAAPQPFNVDLAEQAYTLLAHGQRRAAAARFRRALAAGSEDPRAAAWNAQLRLIEQRWSGSAYVFARANGLNGATAGPVLGGGQSGGEIAYRVDPLAKMPISLVARGSAANNAAQTTQAALGINWQLVPGLSLAAERLVPVGANGRSAWNVRLGGGASAADFGLHVRSVEVMAYAEAGIVGLRRRDLYAAATARVGHRSALGRTGALVSGIAAWGSVQRADTIATRLEVGPTLQLWLAEPLPLTLSVDYRLRIVGNARPASGPALTIATSF